MKILIFSVAYHPFVGGAEIAVKEITDRLPEIEFHLVTVNLDGKQRAQEKVGNVFVYRVGIGALGKFFFPFLALWKGLSLHKKFHFDATWSIMANYAGFAALFFKYLKPHVPFILTLQEGDPIDYIKKQAAIVYPFFIQIFRRADRIQTISNFLAGFARNMGGREPIDVIPNGVDISLFAREYPADEIERAKAKIGKKPGDTFLVTSSRLVIKNGIGDVIRALPFLPEKIKFLVIGSGTLERSLKKLVTDLKLEDRVVFLGLVPNEEIPKYLKAADIFIRPSLSEGLGISFIEAMASGIPIIATPVGGIPDFLRDDETGLFCEVKNPESVAKKVNELVIDDQKCARIVKNAKEMVVTKYDWDLIAQTMKSEVFERILP